MRANAARLAFGGCQSPASIAFIYGNGELPLLKPSKGAILPPNLLESGECRSNAFGDATPIVRACLRPPVAKPLRDKFAARRSRAQG